jgi:hypothetical protein
MTKEKDPAAVSLGRKGGLARAKAIGPARRKAIASKAAKILWAKRKKQGKNVTGM